MQNLDDSTKISKLMLVTVISNKIFLCKIFLSISDNIILIVAILLIH